MKELVLHVEEKKLEVLLNFLRSLDFVKIEESIPDWQQKEVAERMAAYSTDTSLARKWEDAQKDIFNLD